MQLPFPLQEALEKLSETVPLPQLRSAYQALSEAYRRGENSAFSFRQPSQVLAYLFARMPATFAAVYKAMASLQESLPDWKCKSLLDLGAGPGTACWAALELFPELESIALVEQAQEMLEVGKKLASYSDKKVLQNAEWIRQDLKTPLATSADLIVFSYVCAEIDCLDLIVSLYEKGSTILIIEPGTPAGFDRILKLRTALIQKGAFIAAPCPHHSACPTASWCHFPARVERTKIHKLLKEGSLGYEDEKYSYLAVSPLPARRILGRVVDKPLKLSGHVKLSLCTKDGILEQKTITRKQKDLYKEARDAEWSSILKL